MEPNTAISDAESRVMEVLWRAQKPVPAEEVVRVLAVEQDWQEATVKTLLNRLLKKEAIHAEREGRRYLYTPVLSREQWLTSESTSLLNRLFGGRIAPLVAHFGSQRKLSKDDIAELRRLIKDMPDGE